MKTSLLALIGGIALLGGLSVGAANATVFDVSGTLLANPPTTTTNTSLSGNLTIDVSTGTVTGVDLKVPGFPDFMHLDTSEPSGANDWYIATDNGTGCGPAVECLDIQIATSPTGASLVNLESASLVGATLGGGIDTVFYVDVAAGGTVTPTPIPAALPLFATGIGGLGLFGWRRKRKAQAV